MKIGVLGSGKMANALVKGMAHSHEEIQFTIYSPSGLSAKKLATAVKGNLAHKLEDFEVMDWWIIACKPQQFIELKNNLAGRLKDQKIISIMAAIDIATIQNHLEALKVVKIMPNTPTSIGEGICLALFSQEISGEEQLEIENLFSCLGLFIKVKHQDQFDKLTLITGSGPGFLFYLASHYAQLCQEFGQDQVQSKKLMGQLFKGVGLMLIDQEEDFEQLIANVTSKGGVTIEVINELIKQETPRVLKDSINCGIKRSKEISQLYR